MKRTCALLLITALTLLFTLGVFAAEGEYPENNPLAELKWRKLYGQLTITEETVDGAKVTTVSGMNTTYDSAYIDIMPAAQQLLGEDDSVDLWLVMEVRTDADDGEEFPFGVRARAINVSDKVKTMDNFYENYYSQSTLLMNNGKGQVSYSAFSNGILTNQWQRLEIELTVTELDVNKEFWTNLYLCFDTLNEYEDMKNLQIRNVGLFYWDEYEPLDSGEDDTDPLPDGGEAEEYYSRNTPAPVTVYRPYGYNKHTATFIEVTEQDYTNIEQDHTNAPTDAPINGGGTGKNAVLPILGVVGGVILIGAVTVTVVILIKKRKAKEGNE